MPSSDGIDPLNSLPWSPSACRLSRLPSSDGIGPLNWLLLSDSACRLARLPSSDGIGPLNWLLLSDSACRLARLPSSDGIGPLNWLPSSPSLSRLSRLPSSDGIDPLNWLSRRSNSVTRPSASVLTPCHSPNGRLLTQLVSSRQLLPLVVLYKAARAARSVFTSLALGVGCGMAVGVGRTMTGVISCEGAAAETRPAGGAAGGAAVR